MNIDQMTVCLFVLLTPFAFLHAQDTLTASVPYNVFNENSGSCVGASGQHTANGTAVQQYVCANGAYSTQLSQKWIFTSADGGFHPITAQRQPETLSILLQRPYKICSH